jgi:hypothetical protein
VTFTFTYIFPLYVKVSIRPNLRNIKIYRKFSVLMVFVPNIIVGGRTVRGSNARGGEIFCTSPDGPCGPPCLLYFGYPSHSRKVNRLECGVNHPPSSRAEVKEKIELYLCFLNAFMTGWLPGEPVSDY